MNQNTTNTNRNARTYTNTVLTAIAVMLAVLVVDTNDGQLIPISTATAQSSRDAQRGGGGLISAADQRRQMIDAMSEMTGRLERIEGALTKGVNVKVVSMPRDAAEDND